MKPQEFVNALDSDQIIVARVLCRASDEGRRCVCEGSDQCVALGGFGDLADDILDALAARHRLMRPRP